MYRGMVVCSSVKWWQRCWLCVFRFDDEVQEDLEESISNPVDNITAMSVADQIEILEVWHLLFAGLGNNTGLWTGGSYFGHGSGAQFGKSGKALE